MKQARPAAAAALALLASGCALFHRPVKDYVSQDEVLLAVARAAGYGPDEAKYRLRHADVSSDLITFHYQGVDHPGDRAWVIRFAQKSSEQRPEELVDLDRLIRAIAEGKDGFKQEGREQREAGGLKANVARYSYLSPIRDQQGKRLPAGGAAAIIRLSRLPAPVVYHLNVDNMEGDRPDLGWPELKPLVEAIRL